MPKTICVCETQTGSFDLSRFLKISFHKLRFIMKSNIPSQMHFGVTESAFQLFMLLNSLSSRSDRARSAQSCRDKVGKRENKIFDFPIKIALLGSNSGFSKCSDGHCGHTI